MFVGCTGCKNFLSLNGTMVIRSYLSLFGTVRSSVPSSLLDPQSSLPSSTSSGLFLFWPRYSNTNLLSQPYVIRCILTHGGRVCRGRFFLALNLWGRISSWRWWLHKIKYFSRNKKCFYFLYERRKESDCYKNQRNFILFGWVIYENT